MESFAKDEETRTVRALHNGIQHARTSAPAALVTWQGTIERQAPAKTPQLSTIEIEVLRGIAEGLSDGQLAAKLCRSVHTIRSHRDNLLGKTASSNRVELTRFAIAAGHVPVAWRGMKRPVGRQRRMLVGTQRRMVWPARKARTSMAGGQ